MSAQQVDPNPQLHKHGKVAQFQQHWSQHPHYEAKAVPNLLVQKPLTTVPDFSTVKEYNPEELSWDDWHYNNTENKFCYCGHGRTDWAVMPMLICVVCANSFHQACFKKTIGAEEMPMEVSWGHEFICANCSGNGEEKLDLWFPGWSALGFMSLGTGYLEGLRRGETEPEWVSVKSTQERLYQYLDRYKAPPTRDIQRRSKSATRAILDHKHGYVIHGDEVDAEKLHGFWSLRRLVKESWPYEIIPPHVIDPISPRLISPRSERIKEIELLAPSADLTIQVERRTKRQRTSLLPTPSSSSAAQGADDVKESTGKVSVQASQPSSTNEGSSEDSTPGGAILRCSLPRAASRRAMERSSTASSRVQKPSSDPRQSRPVDAISKKKNLWRAVHMAESESEFEIEPDTDTDGEVESWNPALPLAMVPGDGPKLFQRLQLAGGFDEMTVSAIWAEMSERGRNLYLAQAEKLQSR